MVDQLMLLPERTKLQILAPLIKGKKGEHQRVFEEARKAGYVRVRVDGETRDLSEDIELAKNKKHSIEVVIDRISLKPESAERLADSLEIALKLGEGNVNADIIEGEEMRFSENFACPDCGIALEEISPRLFPLIVLMEPVRVHWPGANLVVDMTCLPLIAPCLWHRGIAPWAKSTLDLLPQNDGGRSPKPGFDMDTPLKGSMKNNGRVCFMERNPDLFSYI